MNSAEIFARLPARCIRETGQRIFAALHQIMWGNLRLQNRDNDTNLTDIFFYFNTICQIGYVFTQK